MTRKQRRIKPCRLRDLWNQYTEFQRSQLAPSTIARDYRKVARLLVKMPDYLDTAIEIRDWLLKHYAAETTRRYLMQLNACCNWAVESDLLTLNPFQGLGKQFRQKVNDLAYVGFTAIERDTIIATIEAEYPVYASWVKFLFWTGCRPEEAAALKWEHMTPTYTQIRFSQAAPVDTKKVQATKTWKSRTFPTNQRLQTLLTTLHQSNSPSSDFVLQGLEGDSFDYHNFQTRYWKPTVKRLVNRGEVSIYLPQSHARHTFITLALEHLPVKDVAYLVGNTPTVIYKYYVSRSRDLQVPEF
ncbi:tyrosine-type recombinase/integrase [Egbenema bharatensis]|uniref:tyrosine-type recombinase/integrase n=1 Tax=Egbenema bharatensis TaxID=3463334 RepID=UPI003A85BD1B